MTNVILMFGGILLVGIVIALLDRQARRKERQSENRPAS
jgi:hypothetical protein